MNNTWTTWAADQPQLSRSTQTLLAELLGPLTPSTSVAVDAATVPPSALSPRMAARLAEVVGGDRVHVDDRVRAEHSGGQSYVDIVRRRHGDAAAAPDAVVTPPDADAVLRLLEVCTAERIAVVPWGGGTSVVGGLDAE